MPSCLGKSPEYYRQIKLKREAYRQKLIAKGVFDGGSKMRELMTRKGL